jgi:hypothetical protein
MGLQYDDNRAWVGPAARFAPLLLALSVPAAIAALALPGHVGETAGMASIMLLGTLAALAGHGWGVAVVLAADAGLVANLWPIVTTSFTTESAQLLAAVALTAALPGVAALVLALPRLVGSLIGISGIRARRFATAGSGLALAVWMLAPAMAIQPLSPTAAANPVAKRSAISSTESSTKISGLPVTSMDSDRPEVRPISIKVAPSEEQIAPIASASPSE